MPFDGVLMASRMMVSKEARTALEVKEMIVACEGVSGLGSEWEATYEGEAGGILTVQSELGEPIHKVSNRGMQCWRDFDRRFFSLPREDRGAAIAMAKDEIIAKINADFQKLYFGKKTNGTVVDVELMTYAEVALRMAELMYVLPSQERATDRNPASTPEGRWIDVTFKSRVFKFLQMTEARFSGAGGGSPFCTSDAMLNVKPTEVITEFLAKYPAANTQLLQQQDIDFFLQICKVGGKPVPFIPVIDANLSVWFKKDSLWYSEDLAAVPGRDAGRVCCLQGPVAVTHATKVSLFYTVTFRANPSHNLTRSP
jgi:fatty acid synthase subunit beta